MTIGFREIETSTAEKLVDFAVGLMQILSARVFETDLVDPFQDCIEGRIAYPEAIVLNRDTALVGSEELRVNKVDGQRIVNVHARSLCSISPPTLFRDTRAGGLSQRRSRLLTARVPSNAEYFCK